MEDVKTAIQKTPFLDFREKKTDEEIAAEKAQMEQAFASMNEQTKQQAQTVFDRVKNGEDFAALAKEFSQDPGSKDNDGILDFQKKGTYVKEFDEALFADGLNDGDVVHFDALEGRVEGD